MSGNILGPQTEPLHPGQTHRLVGEMENFNVVPQGNVYYQSWEKRYWAQPEDIFSQIVDFVRYSEVFTDALLWARLYAETRDKTVKQDRQSLSQSMQAGSWGGEARIGMMFQAGRLTCAKALSCEQHVVGGGLPAHQCWGNLPCGWGRGERWGWKGRQGPEDSGPYCTCNCCSCSVTQSCLTLCNCWTVAC